MSYNTRAIRELLTNAFDDQELTTFCYDHYRPVFKRFVSEMGFLWKIQLLIEYCDRYKELDKLLTLVKEINPKQYEEFIPGIKDHTHTPKIDSSSGRCQLEIILKGNLSDFTPEVQSAAVGALAGVLNIPRDQISVVGIRGGSIILQVEIPTEAADQLIALYKANDPIMQDLGIQQVRMIQEQTSQTAAPISSSLHAKSQRAAKFWRNLSHNQQIVVAVISAFATIIAAFIAARGFNPLASPSCQISASEISIERSIIEVNQTAKVSVRADNPDGRILLYNWQTVNGQINPNTRSNSPEAVYTAPSNPVDDTISVDITLENCQPVRRSRSVSVILSSPTPTPTSIIPTTTLTALPPPFITISEPQETLQCTNPASEDDCFFEIKGTIEGVVSFRDFRVYTFINPVKPNGRGWYIQQPAANIGTHGDWTQTPAIIGAPRFRVQDGDTLQIQATIVQADATYNGTKLNASERGFYVSAVQDIDGIVAWSDTVFLTVQR